MGAAASPGGRRSGPPITVSTPAEGPRERSVVDRKIQSSGVVAAEVGAGAACSERSLEVESPVRTAAPIRAPARTELRRHVGVLRPAAPPDWRTKSSASAFQRTRLRRARDPSPRSPPRLVASIDASITSQNPPSSSPSPSSAISVCRPLRSPATRPAGRPSSTGEPALEPVRRPVEPLDGARGTARAGSGELLDISSPHTSAAIPPRWPQLWRHRAGAGSHPTVPKRTRPAVGQRRTPPVASRLGSERPYARYRGEAEADHRPPRC